VVLVQVLPTDSLGKVEAGNSRMYISMDKV